MRSRRRILAAIAVVLALAAAGAVYVLGHDPGNVSNPGVAFEEDTPTPTATPTPAKRRKPPPPFLWEHYGLTPDRKRFLDVPARLVTPPFRRLWTYNGRGLLEFPPAMSARTLFIVRYDGTVQAVSKRTGRVRWSRQVGTKAASSPMLDARRGRLYVTLLERAGGSGGRVAALDTRRGRVLWRRDLPSRTESSPLLDGGSLFLGSEDGTVYALRAATGGVRWRFRAAGPVKAALALKNGRLFFGDYAGRLYAVRASTGGQVWQATTKGARLGFSSGRFYGNAVVSNGRVFIGNTDGYVRSFSAASGELAWQIKTSGYVYASPSVAPGPRGRPTVFIGSYDGTFYALDARSGAVRWRYRTGGNISGGSTVLGHTVWLGDRLKRLTYVLDTRTGRKVWGYRRGGYATVITDKHTLFLVGYGAMYAFQPLSEAQRTRRRERAVRRFARALDRRRFCARRAGRLKGPDRRRSRAFAACVRRRHAATVPLARGRALLRRARRDPGRPLPRSVAGR